MLRLIVHNRYLLLACLVVAVDEESAAGIALREMRLIEIARSQLRIINRQALEQAACECYHLVKKTNDLVRP